MTEKSIIILAGPNGAGKTTYAKTFLPNEAHLKNFINADLIAAGLSPLQPDLAYTQAAKLMTEMINSFVKEGKSFAIESTLSGRSYVQKIRNWQSEVYRVTIIILTFADTQSAINRVTERVKHGGHAIPEDVIRRRFEAGFKNFLEIYSKLADLWLMYDNENEVPSLMDWGTNERAY